MADWSMLRYSGKADYLSQMSVDSGTSFRMMGSWLDQELGSPSFCFVEEKTFCTPENETECIVYLNQELSVLGFQTINYKDSTSLVPSLINRLHEILNKQKRNGRIKEELENRLHRSSSEAEHYRSSSARLKEEREKLLRSLAQEKETERQIVNKNKNLTSKLKSEKEELRRLHAVCDNRNAQYMHEMKKKEREVNKLKERLHQLLMDKNPDRKVGMDLVNSLQRADGRRSTWKTSSNKQEEMYQLIINNYEEKQRELMVENSELRDCLLNMQQELSSVLSRTDLSSSNRSTSQQSPVEDLSAINSDDDADVSLDSNISVNQFTEGYFQMPYHMMSDYIRKSFKETCKKIKQNMKKKPRTTMDSPSVLSISSSTKLHSTGLEGKQESDKELDKLKKQIQKYKDIVHQQEDLIKQSLQSQSQSVEKSFLHESHLLEEKESMAEQKRLFYQEKANFEEERRNFTEAAIRLGRDRKLLEEERAGILKNQFLQLTPFAKQNQSSGKSPKKGISDYACEGTRLLPSTPVFSPAPKDKPKTPTTAELYRLLGLTPGELKTHDNSIPPDINSPVSRSESSDSLLSGSTKSAPCATRISSSCSKRLSMEQIESVKTSLFSSSANKENEDL